MDGPRVGRFQDPRRANIIYNLLNFLQYRIRYRAFNSSNVISDTPDFTLFGLYPTYILQIPFFRHVGTEIVYYEVER